MATDKFIAALIADAPAPGDPNYTLFDPFVGSWNFDLYTYDGGQELLAGRGEWHFSRILDGRAIQDVWECYTKAEPSALLERGTTLRMYDRSRKVWRIVFFSPMRGFVDTLTANKVGDEIVLHGTGRSGSPCLWIFSDIKRDSFQWREEETPDHGRTWTRLELMKLSRQR
jgi:hypothetical protein